MPVVTRCGSVHEVAGWPPHRIPCQMIVAAGTEYARGNHTGLHAGETVRPRKAWFWGEWKPLWPLPAFTLPQLRETGVDGRTPDYPFLARAWEVRLLPQRELWRIACRLLGLPDWMVSR